MYLSLIIFLYSCTRERGVWLGLSDVHSPGKLRWVNGSAAQDGEEGLPPRSPISRGNVCVSFDQNGQTSSHLCDAKRAYVCQYNPQGMSTDPHSSCRCRDIIYEQIFPKFPESPGPLHSEFIVNLGRSTGNRRKEKLTPCP